MAGGIFYLGNNNQPITNNGPCLTISAIIPVVVSSVAEAEYAAVFLNAKEGASLRTILDSLGYPNLHVRLNTRCHLLAFAAKVEKQLQATVSIQ